LLNLINLYFELSNPHYYCRYNVFATSSAVVTFKLGYNFLASKAPPYSGFCTFSAVTVLSPQMYKLKKYSAPAWANEPSSALVTFSIT